MPEALDLLDAHYRSVINAIIDGRMGPFLGVGITMPGHRRGRLCIPGAAICQLSGGTSFASLGRSFCYWTYGSCPLACALPCVAIVRSHSVLPQSLREQRYQPRHRAIPTPRAKQIASTTTHRLCKLCLCILLKRV
jgi:hypothetical protein